MKLKDVQRTPVEFIRSTRSIQDQSYEWTYKCFAKVIVAMVTYMLLLFCVDYIVYYISGFQSV